MMGWYDDEENPCRHFIEDDGSSTWEDEGVVTRRWPRECHKVRVACQCGLAFEATDTGDPIMCPYCYREVEG